MKYGSRQAENLHFINTFKYISLTRTSIKIEGGWKTGVRLVSGKGRGDGRGWVGRSAVGVVPGGRRGGFFQMTVRSSAMLILR